MAAVVLMFSCSFVMHPSLPVAGCARGGISKHAPKIQALPRLLPPQECLAGCHDNKTKSFKRQQP